MFPNLFVYLTSLHMQVKTWSGLLNAFCTNGRLELELMYKVQIQCYEDAKLMKLFPEIIRSLYDQDVVTEDTILLWFRKGANPKGRYMNLLFFLIDSKWMIVDDAEILTFLFVYLSFFWII